MCEILAFEADRRAFIITINSFGTELTKDDREKLYPTCGKLYPDGLKALARADDYEQVRSVAEYYSVSNFSNLQGILSSPGYPSWGTWNYGRDKTLMCDGRRMYVCRMQGRTDVKDEIMMYLDTFLLELDLMKEFKDMF